MFWLSSFLEEEKGKLGLSDLLVAVCVLYPMCGHASLFITAPQGVFKMMVR